MPECEWNESDNNNESASNMTDDPLNRMRSTIGMIELVAKDWIGEHIDYVRRTREVAQLTKEKRDQSKGRT